MILWIYFTLGNIFGFRAESRSEGTRDPLLFSPGARALTPDQQDGVGEKTAAVAEELVFSNSMPTSWKNGALPRMSSRKKIADYFGITVEGAYGHKKKKGFLHLSSCQNTPFCCIYNFMLQQL